MIIGDFVWTDSNKIDKTTDYWLTLIIFHLIELVHIFLIGMHFSQAVAIIQSQIGSIKGVQVLYSETVSKSYHWQLPCNHRN